MLLKTVCVLVNKYTRFNNLKRMFWDGIYLYLIISKYTPDIGLAVRVFANGPGDLRSIPGRVIPKTLKMVLDVSLLHTQHYKVWIKGKVEQSRERSSAPLHLGVVAIEKEAFGSPSTLVANFTFTFYIKISKTLRYSSLSLFIFHTF